MTIPRIKTGGWPSNGTLTATELNSFQTAIERALDRSAFGDTLSGPIQLSGAGRIIPSVAVGPNLDATITVGSSNTVYRIDSTVNGNRKYTLNTGAATGDIIYFYAESSFSSLYKITLVDSSAPTTTLFELGNADAHDGPWVSFIYIGTWRVYQASQGSRLRSVPFTSSDTWTCPRGVNRIMVYGYGGGSAGGVGGLSAGYFSIRGNTGGSGGAGSIAAWHAIPVTPGQSYTVEIGAGGVSNGQTNGKDTLIKSGSTVLATFPGTTGSWNGFEISTQNMANLVPVPGMPIPYNNSHLVLTIPASAIGTSFSLCPGLGGHAGISTDNLISPSYQTTAVGARYGQPNIGPAGLTSGGLAGATSYGGGGGGGGAGPGGKGGNGGIGKTQWNELSGSGESAAANSGAGGGGAGGNGGNTGDAALLGGNGGSGALTIYYVK